MRITDEENNNYWIDYDDWKHLREWYANKHDDIAPSWLPNPYERYKCK